MFGLFIPEVENLNFVLLIITIVEALWLIGITVWFAKIYTHYKRLVGNSKGNLDEVLNKILEQQKLNKDAIISIAQEVKNIIKEGKTHIKRLGMVRFNPFNETGGDSSFSLSLLDDNLNGVVITGLHARERTRVYVKPIREGKSKYELSKEEIKVVKQVIE